MRNEQKRSGRRHIIRYDVQGITLACAWRAPDSSSRAPWSMEEYAKDPVPKLRLGDLPEAYNHCPAERNFLHSENL